MDRIAALSFALSLLVIAGTPLRAQDDAALGSAEALAEDQPESQPAQPGAPRDSKQANRPNIRITGRWVNYQTVTATITNLGTTPIAWTCRYHCAFLMTTNAHFNISGTVTLLGGQSFTTNPVQASHRIKSVVAKITCP
jgi:hypothetical protein